MGFFYCSISKIESLELKSLEKIRSRIRIFVRENHYPEAIKLLENTSHMFDDFSSNPYLNDALIITASLNRLKRNERSRQISNYEIQLWYNNISLQILELMDKMVEASESVLQSQGSKHQ